MHVNTKYSAYSEMNVLSGKQTHCEICQIAITGT